MKNLNVVIYLVLGLVIVSLLGIIFYLYQDNLKKESALEKQNAIKPMAEIPINDIFDALQDATLIMGSSDEEKDRAGILSNLDNETKYCGTAVDFAKVYLKKTDESLSGARKKAKEAYFKATVFATIPAVNACIEKKGFVNSPKEDESICQGDNGKWPNFSDVEGAQWGGCNFEIDKGMRTFKYCATYGNVKAVCTQDGCKVQ